MATFFLVVPATAPLVGVLVGGMLSDRLGRVRTVALFLVGFVIMIAGLAVTDLRAGTFPGALMAWLTGMYLFVGMFTAASYAWYMDLTDPALGGTQYSMFMSAMNGCESWAAKVGGMWVRAHGYPWALGMMCGISLLSLPILWWAQREGRSRVTDFPTK